MLEKKLNELSIFALREAARRTGVASPTSKKKEQLIKEIMAIKSGEMQPQLTKTRQGRPPKDVNYNLTSLNGGFEYSKNFSSGVVTLKQNSESFKVEESLEISGYLDFSKDGASLVWEFKNLNQVPYFVPQDVVSSYQLKLGDFIVAEAVSTINTNVVKEILSINGCPVKKFKNERKDYFDIDPVIPNQQLEFKTADFNNLQIKKGEALYVYGNNCNEKTQAVIDLLNQSKVDERLYLNVAVAEKNKVYLKEIANAEKVTVSIVDDLENAKRAVALVTERAKRILEAGKNALLVIDDLLSVLSVDDQSMTLTKKLISLSKASKQGSVTIVVNVQGTAGETMFERLADKRMFVDNKKLQIK